MSRLAGLILSLCVCVSLVDAQTPHRDPRQVPTVPLRPGMPRLAQPQTRQAPMLLVSPALKSPNLTPVACPESTADLCGYMAVPLDRRHPKGAQIQIYFERYPHTRSGPAESAILVNLGGPGAGTTIDRDYFQFLFANNLDVHDLLLVDDRGRGLSGAIDCPELQHGTAPFAPSEIDCAAQLGDAASRYGTGDIAQDMEALREALGYERVDYLGASWGGVDATAYATRYPNHTRSLVLDAPVSPPNMAALLRQHYRAHADPRVVRLDCLRSVLCSQDQPYPDATLAALIQTVRESPIEGDGHDVFGNVVHVRIDEDALLYFIVTYPSGAFINTGEILAAAVALKQGDTAPLLRLGAEGFFTLVGDSGDPTGFSAGAFYATGCMDTVEAFDWSATFSEREQQYDEAVDELPFHYFAPFSKGPATGILYSTLGRQCFWWERPTAPSPIVPPNGMFPNVPMLVLDGDLDNRVPFEMTNQTAALYPNSTTVVVAEAGHETTGWTQCARNLATQFIETLQPGDTSCANTPEVVWPAVGRFPFVVADARPATPDASGSNQIGIAERKTVSVSVATAIDALQRSLVNAGDGVGLRGGTFHTDYFGATTITTTMLTNCMFATDVVVNGTILWGYDNSITADLTISGTGTAGGTLHVTGFFENPGPVGNFSVTGTLGGRQVAVLVPEA